MSSATRSVGVMKGGVVNEFGEPWDDVLSPDAWDELQALQLGEVKLQRLSSQSDHDISSTTTATTGTRLNSTSEESVIQMLGVGALLPPFHYSLDSQQPLQHHHQQPQLAEGYSSDTVPGESPFSHPSPSSPLSSSSLVSSPLPMAGTEGWGVSGEVFEGHFDMGQMELQPANFKYEPMYLSDGSMDASNDEDSEGPHTLSISHQQPHLAVPPATSGSRSKQTAPPSSSTRAQATPKQATAAPTTTTTSGSRVPRTAAVKREQQQQVVPQQQQQQQQQHTFPTGLSTSVHSALGHLIDITSQPAKFARFRYKNEKRSQQLEGECGPIEVTLRPDVITRARNITIKVSLITSSGACAESRTEAVGG